MKYRSVSEKIYHVVLILIMIFILLVVVFPYLNVFAKAFNDGKDTARGGITIYPRKFTTENFETVFSDKYFPKAFLISVVTVICSTVLGLFVQFTAAYAFTKKDLVGRRALLVILMIPMYVSGGLMPTYILFSKIGLLNNYLVYVLPGCFSLYNMVFIRSYLATIPYSLNESAKIDGASDFRILTQIILPLSKPILATIALWIAVGKWNDWTTPLYFITKRYMYNLQYLLQQVLKETEKMQQMIQDYELYGQGNLESIQMNITTESIKSAQIVITTVPIVITYPFLQKYFISGITLGAVKE